MTDVQPFPDAREVAPDPVAMTKAEMALQILRRQIVSGQRPPGSRLRLRDLAAELNLSVMPIRDALGTLEGEGLVVSEDHRGARVSNVSGSELLDIISLRMWMEVYATRMAVPRHDKRSVAAIKQALTAGARASRRQDTRQFTEANRAFHAALEAPVTGRTRDLIRELWNQAWQVRRNVSVFEIVPEHMSVAHGDHQQIFEAVAAGDADRAADKMEHHRRSSVAAWTTAVERVRLGELVASQVETPPA